MSSESSLSKRIKRHVIGRRHSYFAGTSPGFETLCYEELSALGLSVENVAIIEGGVEFEGRLQDCYLANLHLRTASRILLRIDQFKASGFRHLEKKAAEIPWELYLPPTMIPQIHVTTKHCRLYHSDAIGQRFLDGISMHSSINDFDQGEENDFTSDLTVFVRGVDDRFMVSIDSSGNHLHKRGLKRHRGKAPLRETQAAAALLMTGYNGTGPLMDPMCGTGTFSLEAALIAKNIPPGWFREFAFMQWPSFSQKRWKYLKSQCVTKFANPQKPLIFASDQDSAACSRLEKCIQKHKLSDLIKVFQKDFFDFIPEELTDDTGMVVINPPYGRRLGNLEKSDHLFVAICDKLKHDFMGWKLVLVAPDRNLVKKIPFQLDALPFFHGGLKPTLMFGRIT